MSAGGAGLGPPVAEGTGRGTGFTLVLLGAVLWGTGGVTGASLGEAGDLPPVAVASVRLGVGGVALLALLALLRAVRGRTARPVPLLPRTRQAVGRVALVGLLAAGYQAAYFAAVDLTSVSVATFVALGAAPVLVALSTALRRRRPPSARVLISLALALVGLGLLTGAGGPSERASGVGLTLALGAASCFALLTLVNRRGVPGLGPLAMTGASFTVGGVLLAPVAVLGVVVAGPREGLVLDAGGAGAGGGRLVLLVLFLGLVPTALAYAAYFSGLRTVPATTASLVALLEPVTAAVIAAVLLGERLGPAGVLGGLVLGLAVIAVRPRPLPGGRLAYDGRRSVLNPRRTGAPTRPDPPPSGAGS
ncbi:DMT family transporter [Actinotalea sp. BY-33]|uniref:DMT family transporter n=1 Tax=Actinotalea soli TaxID=2819234 RepID=A0A939LRP1_9CELL|nr:DMT family transporter [Actinotalea soli]MBO1750904.1 DMT family transporter [Actinotalea soli]